MKSMTIRPPTSRNRSWRAISSAASRLVLQAVVSMSRAARAARRVDVDRDQRLGVVDHDAAAGGQRDLVRVRRLDLALDLVAREERHVVVVELELAQVARHEALHVLLRFVEHLLLVDQDLADVVGEVVAQRAQDRLAFLVDQERRGAALRTPAGSAFQTSPRLLRSHCSSSGVRPTPAVRTIAPMPSGICRLSIASRSCVAVLALDAARDAAGARVVRHQHQEASGQADERGERSALVAALFLLDLDDEFLAFLEQVADAGAAAVLARLLSLEIFAWRLP